jgi:hypothetical protein
MDDIDDKRDLTEKKKRMMWMSKRDEQKLGMRRIAEKSRMNEW